MTSNSNQVNASEFDAGNVSCTKPKLNKKNKKLQALLLYAYEQAKGPLYFETPEALFCPFGLSQYEAVEDSGKYDYSLPMTIRSSIPSEQPVVDNFFQQLQDLDEFMIDFGVEYSQQIFGQEYTPEQRMIVEALYSRCVRKPKKNKEGELYPLKISPKVVKVWEDKPTSVNGVPNVEVYTTSQNDMKPESWENLMEMLPKGCSVTAILQPRIWFVSGKFGLSLRVLKLKIMPFEKRGPPKGYSFSKPPAPADEGDTTTQEQVPSPEGDGEASTAEGVSENASAEEEVSGSGEEDVVDSGEELEDEDEELEDEEIEDVEEVEAN